VLKRQSALDSISSGDRNDLDRCQRLRIGEVRGWDLTQLAAFPGTQRELASGAEQIFNCSLPTRIGEVRDVGNTRIFMTGPAQFWILTRCDSSLIPALMRVVASEMGAITPLSHSRTCLLIEGPDAREVLSGGIALDLHPEEFRVGHFALTGWHHTPILLHRTGDDRYELYVMRTFAQWLWECLTDAALPSLIKR
jgi:methylglutamate dehydrogenase subunit D